MAACPTARRGRTPAPRRGPARRLARSGRSLLGLGDQRIDVARQPVGGCERRHWREVEHGRRRQADGHRERAGSGARGSLRLLERQLRLRERGLRLQPVGGRRHARAFARRRLVARRGRECDARLVRPHRVPVRLQVVIVGHGVERDRLRGVGETRERGALARARRIDARGTAAEVEQQVAERKVRRRAEIGRIEVRAERLPGRDDNGLVAETVGTAERRAEARRHRRQARGARDPDIRRRRAHRRPGNCGRRVAAQREVDEVG